jgi:hypothetical protein
MEQGRMLLISWAGIYMQNINRSFAMLRTKIFPTIVRKNFGRFRPGTDVMILKIFSPKNSAKKFGVFDSKQS